MRENEPKTLTGHEPLGSCTPQGAPAPRKPTTIVIDRDRRRLSVELPILGHTWLDELSVAICGDGYTSVGEAGWVYVSASRAEGDRWTQERRLERQREAA